LPVSPWAFVKTQTHEQGTHNPLVVCSNHTGPSSIRFRDFQCGSRFQGCGISTPGSGTGSNTVSKRPREHPLDGLERRSG
jgi:hypothetical protein